MSGSSKNDASTNSPFEVLEKVQTYLNQKYEQSRTFVSGFKVEDISVDSIKSRLSKVSVADIKSVFNQFEKITGTELPSSAPHAVVTNTLKSDIQVENKTYGDKASKLKELLPPMEAAVAQIEDESAKWERSLPKYPDFQRMSANIAAEIKNQKEKNGGLMQAKGTRNVELAVANIVIQYRSVALSALLLSELNTAISQKSSYHQQLRDLMLKTNFSTSAAARNGAQPLPFTTPILQYSMLNSEFMEMAVNQSSSVSVNPASLFGAFHDKIYSKAQKLYWNPTPASPFWSPQSTSGLFWSIAEYVNARFWNAITAPQPESDLLCRTLESLSKASRQQEELTQDTEVLSQARENLQAWCRKYLTNSRVNCSGDHWKIRNEIQEFTKRLDHYIRCIELKRYLQSKVKQQQRQLA